jgi:catechol 2,3-dioxygenase-like lactoylglutathione lyase family enzyme
MHNMSAIRHFDHVGITVRDLDTVTAFFVGLGFETEGRTVLEGEFLDTVIGIPNSRTEIAMLRPPDGGTGLELSSFIRPNHEPGSPDPMPNELGLRNVTFEVDDLQAILDRLAADGYRLVGGVGQYEGIWRMASVRGPEGFIVNLAQRIN